MLTVSFALFLVAWMVTDPPGAPPDEPNHYLKAVAAGDGQLRDAPPGPVRPGTGIEGLELAWMNRTTRVFNIPRGPYRACSGRARGRPGRGVGAEQQAICRRQHRARPVRAPRPVEPPWNVVALARGDRPHRRCTRRSGDLGEPGRGTSSQRGEARQAPGGACLGRGIQRSSYSAMTMCSITGVAPQML